MSGYSGRSIALALIPKFTGALSLGGSLLIFQDVMRDPKKRHKVYHRLMLGMSSFDIMASVVNVLSTWPIPRGTSGVFLASGTTETCTAQGFFNEMGNMCTPLYNASLCLYYVLIIREGWSESKLRQIEPYLHAFPLITGWFMAIVGLPLSLFNNSGWLCWIAPYPSQCLVDPTVPCERGALASVFRWVHYGLIWSAIAFVTAGMTAIYLTVRRKEKASARYTHASYQAAVYASTAAQRAAAASAASQSQSGVESAPPAKRGRRASFFTPAGCSTAETPGGATSTSTPACPPPPVVEEPKSHSRKVAKQAMLFVSALYLTWAFTTLTRIFQIVQGTTYFPLLVLMATFFPLQGFFNAFIYLRPRLIRARKRNPHLSRLQVFVKVVRAAGKDGDDTDYSASRRENQTSIASRVGRRLSNIVARRSTTGRRSSTGGGSLCSIDGSVSGKVANIDIKKDGFGSSDAEERDSDSDGAGVAAAASSPEDNNPPTRSKGLVSFSLKGLMSRSNQDLTAKSIAAAGAGRGNDGGVGGSKLPHGSVQWAAEVVAKELAELEDLDLSDDDDDFCDDTEGDIEERGHGRDRTVSFDDGTPPSPGADWKVEDANDSCKVTSEGVRSSSEDES